MTLTLQTGRLKQLQEFTKFPFRPAQANVQLDSAELLNIDVDPVNWSLSPTSLNTRLFDKVMDDLSDITDGGTFLDVGPGQYKIDIHFHVRNGSVNAEDFRVAVTNGDGSTVHFESDPIQCPANADMTYSATVLVHVTDYGQDLAIRAAQVTDTGGGTDLTLSNSQIGAIRKIGNVNEN